MPTLKEAINDVISKHLGFIIENPGINAPTLIIKEDSDGEVRIAAPVFFVAPEGASTDNNEWSREGKNFRDFMLKMILSEINVNTTKLSKIRKEQIRRVALHLTKSLGLEGKINLPSLSKGTLKPSNSITLLNDCWTYEPSADGIKSGKRTSAMVAFTRCRDNRFILTQQPYSVVNGATVLGERREEEIEDAKGNIPDILRTYSFEIEGKTADEIKKIAAEEKQKGEQS